MIHISLDDLARSRRRQEIHAAELADAGLIKKEEDTEFVDEAQASRADGEEEFKDDE